MSPEIHIVDDDADFREGLAWLFDSRGHKAGTWSGGDVFLQAVRARLRSVWRGLLPRWLDACVRGGAR
jgi:FixJ family two-component response regulator